MTLEAIKSHLADDLCNAYQYLPEADFSAYSTTLREKILKVALENGGSEKSVPLGFPERSKLSTFLHPLVSPADKLFCLQEHRYSCSLPLKLNDLLDKPIFSQTAPALSQRIRKGIVLRFLSDHRDEPFGRRNNILWRTNHFVGI